jgi:hypothetical protein
MATEPGVDKKLHLKSWHRESYIPTCNMATEPGVNKKLH